MPCNQPATFPVTYPLSFPSSFLSLLYTIWELFSFLSIPEICQDDLYIASTPAGCNYSLTLTCFQFLFLLLVSGPLDNFDNTES